MAPVEHGASFAEDYKEAYAWRAGVSWQLWDIILQFGNTPQNKIHNSGAISMGIRLSPQTAKSLAQILTSTIAQYESMFGEIKVEPLVGMPTEPTPKKEVM